MAYKELKISHLKTLIVDRSDFSLTNIRSILHKISITDVKIEKKIDAAETLIKKSIEDHYLYDLIIVDYDISKFLTPKKVEKFLQIISPRSCLVLTSADHSKENIIRMLENEPDDILLKPYRIDILKNRLRNNARNVIVTGDLRKALEQRNSKEILEAIHEIERHNEYGISSTWLNKLKIKATYDDQLYEKTITAAEHFLSYSEAEWARNYLCRSLVKESFYDKAIQEAKIGRRKYPMSTNFCVVMGQAFLMKGDIKQAEIQFRKAAAINPDCIDASLGLVESIGQHDNVDKLVKRYEKLFNQVEGTIYDNVDYYIDYANALKELSDVSVIGEQMTHLMLADEILKKGKANFPNESIVDINIKLQEVARDIIECRTNNALNMLNDIVDSHQEDIISSVSTTANVAFMYDVLCEKDRLDKFLTELELSELQLFNGVSNATRIKQLTLQRYASRRKGTGLSGKDYAALKEEINNFLHQNDYDMAAVKLKELLDYGKYVPSLILFYLKLRVVGCIHKSFNRRSVAAYNDALNFARNNLRHERDLHQLDMIVKSYKSDRVKASA
ncbi:MULTISPECIES: hypothetical protein [Vibrio]|uniref:Response regulatory domain-containing protein n=2 Tax=Vibrio TaxID=662 RepID=A0A7X4LLT0_9VIBR|nr:MULTISPECIES: hypothetical protein [Vibrio]MBF9002636.1 hypothetical protein [Vibrio nitrifigilis]MZI93916.1 hypothetical protein [Vibrio eleionomae]